MAFTRFHGSVRKLVKLPRTKSILDVGAAIDLPDAYKKFWREWKILKPTSVDYISPHYKWKRNEFTGEIKHMHSATIIDSSNGKNLKVQQVRCGKDSKLKRSVVKSEVLNTHLSVTVSQNTLEIINDHYGFDHYLLKTLACDLVSLHALKLKKQILIELKNGCPRLANNPQKQRDIYEKYKIYLESYSNEDIEWYGLTWIEALEKILKIKADQNKSTKIENEINKGIVKPLTSRAEEIVKHDFSNELTASWMSNFNILGKNDEA